MLDFKYKLMKKKTIFLLYISGNCPKNIACYEINADFVFGISNQSKCQRFSQDIRVSLDCQNERLGDVFKELEKQLINQ